MAIIDFTCLSQFACYENPLYTKVIFLWHDRYVWGEMTQSYESLMTLWRIKLSHIDHNYVTGMIINVPHLFHTEWHVAVGHIHPKKSENDSMTLFWRISVKGFAHYGNYFEANILLIIICFLLTRMIISVCFFTTQFSFPQVCTKSKAEMGNNFITK